MEQHPVPQNVTTFQFRLIGDMTLKQFGYLCGGAILAFIAYRLPLPILFTWPLAFGFAFLGVGFAFIPVEERPMDVWVFSFFKNVYSPTQFVWMKTAQKQAAPQPQPQPQPIQAPPPPPSPQKPSKPAVSPQPSSQTQKPAPSVSTILSSLWGSKPTPPPQPHFDTTPPPIVLPKVTGTKIEEPKEQPKPPATQQNETVFEEKVKSLETDLASLQKELTTKNVASDRVLELQEQLTQVLQQKSKMEEELVALKRQLTKEPPQTQPAPGQSPSPQNTVHVINSQDQATKAGLPRLTNVANVITGIVKDNEGNLLPAILVTVTNSEQIPVRALKTNKLGQFGASTPLSPGVYFIEVEDPRQRFTFSRVQITLNGAVVPALEIIAKSQKQLTREKLAQEIFGKTQL